MDAELSIAVDFEKNSAELSITKDIYVRILKKGIEQTQGDIPSIDTAIDSGNIEEIKEKAHRLKGDFFNMRIDQLSSLAKQVEEVAKTTADKEELKKTFSQFKILFEQLTKKADNEG